MNPQFMMIFNTVVYFGLNCVATFLYLISIMNTMLLLAMEMTDETVTRVI